MDQNQEPRNKPCVYSQLIFHKGAMNAHWGNDSIFNKCWENCVFTYERMNLHPILHHTQKETQNGLKTLM